MPLFAVTFDDDPVLAAEIRHRHMPAHLAFLDDHAAMIRAAGPLRDPAGEAAGGLWLVQAPEVGQVEALVQDDPFWHAGLRRSVRVLVWAQVFADGARRA